MHLGEPTLTAMTLLLFVIWALRGAMLWRVQRAYPGHSRWTAAGLLILGALCVFNMWPLTAGWIFMAAANTMAVTAPVLYLEGAREFRGLPPRSWLAYSACAAVIAATVYFEYVAPSLKARVYVVSSFMGIVFTLASIQLLKGSVPGRRLQAAFTGCMSALCGVVIVARAFYFYLAQPSSNAPSGINGVFFLAILAAVGGLSLGIVLLADERAKLELANEKEKALRANAEAAEHKQAAAALRESEERFRSLAESAPVMIWEAGPDKLCTFFNQQWLDFTGRTMEQELGNGWAEGVHPEDLDRCMAIYSSSFDARGKFQMGYRLRRADGEYRWILDRGKPFHRDGEFAGYIGSCIDLTERKRMEERLRASEARFADAQRLAKIGSWEQHLEGDSIQWSGEMFRIFGLPRETPPNFAAYLNYVHPKDRQTIVESSSNVRSSDQPVDVEYRIVRPDGSVRHLRSIIEAIKDEQGAAVRVVGATQDVTEEVEARELIRKSEERLKNAERMAHVGNWNWDIKANRLFWSEELCRIFGRTENFTPSYEAFLQCIVANDRDRLVAAVSDSLAGKGGYSIEFQVARPNGELRTVTCASRVLFDEEGSPVQMFGACQDITDFRRAQEETMARQKLETVGTLANGIAHDFNNLLGAVLAQAELAQQELAAGLRPEEELQAIRDVAVRGSEIVRQLMIYAGKESEVPGPADISQTVGEMVELLKVSVSKHVTLETELGVDLPAVRGNAAQISQIVINLVKNGSEAIGGRAGTIRVSTRCASVQQDSPGTAVERLPPGIYLQLEVSDTGEGMPLETQARVFDPFFTTKSAGRGLGLAVVHGIVRSMDGAIHLASEPGKGARFEILLPRAETAVETERGPMPRHEAPAQASPAATILVVEDEDSLRIAASKMFRGAGFSVLEASDGSAALGQVREQKGPIDLLFLDITLPGASSREVLEDARRLRPEIRVIVTSAYSEDVVVASLQGGFEGFIRKPYRLGDLADLVRQALSRPCSRATSDSQRELAPESEPSIRRLSAPA